MHTLNQWFRRLFTDPQAVALTLLLLGLSLAVILLGRMLAPVLAALVIAYVLEGPVGWLGRLGLARATAVWLVFGVCAVLGLWMLLKLLPLLSVQLTQLARQLPLMVAKGQELLLALPAHYPEFVDQDQILGLIARLKTELAGLAQRILAWSLYSVIGLITLAVYLVLVPLLVFFFLKDKQRLLDWFRRFLPQDHGRLREVWRQMDRQLSNYVRGKVWEILIVWCASYICFAWLDLQFAMLLALMTGLSVIVPYLGALLAWLPVTAVAWSQWGWSPEFAWAVTAYWVIQGLDGNILVPLLFSEVVDLHPVAIIVAVLVFGGLWGIWGLFFAVPLATVVQVLLGAWPHHTPIRPPP